MLWKNRRKDTSKPLFLFTIGALCAASLAAHADTSPASAPSITNLRKPVGLKTAVVAAIDNGGDGDIAMRALKAANIALLRSDGYAVMSPVTVATNLKKAGLRYP